MEGINYKELLKKYMKHVDSCEGSLFLGYHIDIMKDSFTEEELRTLKSIEAEIS